MSSEHLLRAQAVKVQMDKVLLRAERAEARGDREAITACREEADLLYESLLDIRAEQIADQLPKPKSKRRRWWHVRKRYGNDQEAT